MVVRDGDWVSFLYRGECREGVAIVDGPVLLVELDGIGVVRPDRGSAVVPLVRAGEDES